MLCCGVVLVVGLVVWLFGSGVFVSIAAAVVVGKVSPLMEAKLL